MKHVVVFILMTISAALCGQTEKFSPRDFGTLSVHGGSILFINTASLVLESPDLLDVDNHHLRLNIGGGVFYAAFFSIEKGLQFNGAVEYYTGKNGNHFEVDLGIIAVEQNNTDEVDFFGMDVQASPRVFIGYRYESTETPVFFKVGLGFVEVLQLGFGYRFARKTAN